MGLIPTGQIAVFEAAAESLWEDMQKSVTIVKKATIAAMNTGASFIPGYGPSSNDANYTYTPVSGTFNCLRVTLRPDGIIDSISDKAVSTESLYIKVKQAAHDFISDGENEHAVYQGKKYNITSQDQATFFLGRSYFYFKLELTN